MGAAVQARAEVLHDVAVRAGPAGMADAAPDAGRARAVSGTLVLVNLGACMLCVALLGGWRAAARRVVPAADAADIDGVAVAQIVAPALGQIAALTLPVHRRVASVADAAAVDLGVPTAAAVAVPLGHGAADAINVKVLVGAATHAAAIGRGAEAETVAAALRRFAAHAVRLHARVVAVAVAAGVK